jgi:hypothetical protein
MPNEWLWYLLQVIDIKSGYTYEIKECNALDKLTKEYQLAGHYGSGIAL